MPAFLLLLSAAGWTYFKTGSWILAGFADAAIIAVSAFLHPYIDCGTCDGKGQHRGFFFFWARRPCHACSGTGTKQRPAAVALGIGQPRRSGSRIQPATRTFGSRR